MTVWPDSGSWQQLILLFIAVFVGLRVDHERLAQSEAKARDDARRMSDARYRTLFDQAAEAVLVLGPDGRVEEANAAASRLLGRRSDKILGVNLAQLAGAEIAAEISRSDRAARPLALRPGSEEQPVWVEVLASRHSLTRIWEVPCYQVILHDVTLQTERQQTLEQYARRTVRTREEERRRIGRELHDGPLQSLMLLLRGLEAVESLPTPDPTPDPLVDARDLAEQTADELRRISRALRPSILDDLGLVPAIRSEASAMARRSGLRVGFAAIGTQGPMAPEVELVLFRIAQEALHNVERHASASAATVRLRFGRTQTCLIIRDDGQGLDQSASASTLLAAGKLGLVGMEERTRLVGGEFAARGRPPPPPIPPTPPARAPGEPPPPPPPPPARARRSRGRGRRRGGRGGVVCPPPPPARPPFGGGLAPPGDFPRGDGGGRGPRGRGWVPVPPGGGGPAPGGGGGGGGTARGRGAGGGGRGRGGGGVGGGEVSRTYPSNGCSGRGERSQGDDFDGALAVRAGFLASPPGAHARPGRRQSPRGHRPSGRGPGRGCPPFGQVP